jgi:DNA mismatch repair protein MutL
MPIRVLPPAVAAAIAAGEVIERPASVAKELVENAIDAGARSIHVEIERGGLDLIRVVDDGCGIPANEIETACLRHATSKLSSDSELTRLRTLGFRGEALPSIIAAADTQIASRTSVGAPGVLLRCRDGVTFERGSYGGALGTTVTARGLFARQPARLKFLRSPASEASAVVAAVQPYALAQPGIRLTVVVDGRTVLASSGSGVLRDAAARVLGAEIAAQLLELEPADEAGQRATRVRGLIAPPSLSRGTRAAITILVNGRSVQPRRLAIAVEQAYLTLLPVGRHPLAIVQVEVAPEDVDVNVHPTKAEVRFKDERAVFGAVLAAARTALGPIAPVQSWEPGGSLLSEARVIAAAGQAPLPGEPPPFAPALWQTLLHPQEHDGHAASAYPPPIDAPRLPLLRVVGQTASTYVVAEGPTGMYLIDQHAAHERVTYEKLKAQRANAALDVQGLLAPASVELSSTQAAAYAAHAEALPLWGFAIEPFGERTLLLRAVPAVLAGRDAARALTELLDALAEDLPAPDDDRLLKTLACHGSVRAGRTLTPDEMRALVLQLEECDQPRTCPHGRPTMVHLSVAALEREFRRR